METLLVRLLRLLETEYAGVSSEDNEGEERSVAAVVLESEQGENKFLAFVSRCFFHVLPSRPVCALPIRRARPSSMSCKLFLRIDFVSFVS